MPTGTSLIKRIPSSTPLFLMASLSWQWVVLLICGGNRNSPFSNELFVIFLILSDLILSQAKRVPLPLSIAKVRDESPKWLKTSPLPNKKDDTLRASEVNSLGGSRIKLPRLPDPREERPSVVRLLFRTKSSCDKLV